MDLKKLKRYTKCRFSVLGWEGGGPRPWEQALKCDIIIYVTKNQVDTYYDQN